MSLLQNWLFSAVNSNGAVSPEMLLAMSVLAGLKLRRRRAMLPG